MGGGGGGLMTLHRVKMQRNELYKFKYYGIKHNVYLTSS